MPKVAVLTDNSTSFTFIDQPIPQPGPDEIVVKTIAAGVNVVDTIEIHSTPKQTGFGYETVGRVVAAGANTDFDRDTVVVCFTGAPGAFAEYRCIPKSCVVALPSELDPIVAAGLSFKGALAHAATVHSFVVRIGMNVGVSGAATATGQAIASFLLNRGAKVIGIVSRDDEINIALSAGCNAVVVANGDEDIAAKVINANDGKKLHGLYDGTGFSHLDCLENGAMIVAYHYTPKRTIAVRDLQRKSLFFTSPHLPQYKTDRNDLIFTIGEISSLRREGKLNLEVEKMPFDAINEAIAKVAACEDYRSIVLCP